MQIARVQFVVDNACQWRDWFVEVLGLPVVGDWCEADSHTIVLQAGIDYFWVTAPRSDNPSGALRERSPAARYLQDHPPGVANVAFVTEDFEGVLDRALAQGAQLVRGPQAGEAEICSPVGLHHTLLAASGASPPSPVVTDFTGIDHIVLNVPQGQLAATVAWYEQVFGFQRQQRFVIQTNYSALHSQVLVHPTSGLRWPVNEPASANSQIQEFLEANRGAGIQHLALGTADILATTARRRAAGLRFLPVSPCYYEQAQVRYADLDLGAATWQAIAQQQILLDSQAAPEGATTPLLLQIFTQPIFGAPTFFFEFIERRHQAQGFGEGNFLALVQAIEAEQRQRGSSLPA